MADIKIPQILFYDLCWLLNGLDQKKLPENQAECVERCKTGLQEKLQSHQRRLEYIAKKTAP